MKSLADVFNSKIEVYWRQIINKQLLLPFLYLLDTSHWPSNNHRVWVTWFTCGYLFLEKDNNRNQIRKHYDQHDDFTFFCQFPFTYVAVYFHHLLWIFCLSVSLICKDVLVSWKLSKQSYHIICPFLQISSFLSHPILYHPNIGTQVK